MLHDFIQTALLLVTGLFPIINPPASGIIVLSMIPRATAAERAELAWRITTNSFAILLGSLLIGAYVLKFFGISIPVLRFAGGLIISMAGWNLLHQPDEDDSDGEPGFALVSIGAAIHTLLMIKSAMRRMVRGIGSRRVGEEILARRTNQFIARASCERYHLLVHVRDNALRVGGH